MVEGLGLREVLGIKFRVLGFGLTCSLHCSSLFWLNQFYTKDPKR